MTLLARRAAWLFFLAAQVSVAGPARAHHGIASIGVAGPEGPGAAVETMSALTLPGRTVLVLDKLEVVPFQSRAFAEPENKKLFVFDTVVAGYGITSWLSAFVMQPLVMKRQQSLGTSSGAGDPTLMLTFSFKIDGGLRLIPERESLDDLADWHFAVAAGCTLPLGGTEARDTSGAPFAPDMQTGFGTPSPSLTVAAMKQIGERATWLADVNAQTFPAHSYSFTRYRFGTELRTETALVYRLVGQGQLRLDGFVEVSALHLQRDRERAGDGNMQALTASGGTVLYGSGGLRLYLGRLSAAVAVKRAARSWLNERDEQQGSEGLEVLRASALLSYSFGI